MPYNENMRLKFLSKFLLTSFVIFSFFSAFNVFAISPSSISVDVAPANPAPNENVVINLSSFAANLDSVNITWLVNGKTVISGIGKKSFSLTAGASGSNTTVLAKIALPDGEIDKSIIIRPSVMVLLWQASDSYVPPFYKGKALLTSESEIKIVAMPEIRTGAVNVNPKTLTYSWQKDYTNVGNNSGYGKNSFTFFTDYLDKSNNVSVTASTIDQRYSSQANINTIMSFPKISFYRIDNDLGTIWEKALGDGYRISGDEIVMAEPYFITPKELFVPDLTFRWFINDIAVSINNGFQKNVMPLRVQTGVAGTSKLKAEIENTANLSGGATKEISVQF
jgi:hypothetical protein